MRPALQPNVFSTTPSPFSGVRSRSNSLEGNESSPRSRSNSLEADSFERKSPVVSLDKIGSSTPVLQPGPGGYSSVSGSASTHDLAKMSVKQGIDTSTKPNGWSFVDKKVEAQDVTSINGYINHLRRGGTGTYKDKDQVVSHAAQPDNSIRFTVGDRTYSTHTNTSQLFPVSGGSIVSGVGPAAYKAELKRQGKLDVESYYKLSSLETNPNATIKPWKNLSNKDKGTFTQGYNAYNK